MNASSAHHRVLASAPLAVRRSNASILDALDAYARVLPDLPTDPRLRASAALTVAREELTSGAPSAPILRRALNVLQRTAQDDAVAFRRIAAALADLERARRLAA